MRKFIKLLIIFGASLSLYSCMVNKKGFNIFEHPIVNNSSKIPISTDGIYVANEGKSYFIFLFNDGSARIDGFMNNFWEDTSAGLEISKSLSYESKEFWGHYEIINDTIIIQSFSRITQRIYKRCVHEFKGIVVNDTSILFLSMLNPIDEFQLLEEPILYKFLSTKEKPDSTKAWFNNKKWFRENLHESRKPR